MINEERKYFGLPWRGLNLHYDGNMAKFECIDF